MKTCLRVCDLPAALARLGSRKELVKEMLDLFREDATIFQDRLSAAIAEGDAQGVLHASHSLRGMMSMFGAESAMEVALLLEQMARNGALAGAVVENQRLNFEITQFLRVAALELSKL